MSRDSLRVLPARWSPQSASQLSSPVLQGAHALRNTCQQVSAHSAPLPEDTECRAPPLAGVWRRPQGPAWNVTDRNFTPVSSAGPVPRHPKPACVECPVKTIPFCYTQPCSHRKLPLNQFAWGEGPWKDLACVYGCC